GTGFFVSADGFLRDPLGNQFTMRGLNRNHFDSFNWAGPASGALAYPNTVRVFMFDGSTAAFAANQVATQYAPNSIFTILVQAGATTGTTGYTTPVLVLQALNNWINYQSGLSGVMTQIAINLVNEWGPTNAIAWQYAYQAVVGNLSGISGTTVTVNTVAGANPFLNCPYAYISGAGGVSNRLVFLSSPGGVNGAWT